MRRAALLVVLSACSRGQSSPASADAGTTAPPKAVFSTAASASSHALAGVAPRPAPVPQGYSRRKTFPVTKDPKLAGSAVELLEDERIRSEQLPKHGQVLGGDPCKPFAFVPSPPFCKALQVPLLPARVRLVASDGRELSTLTMERPLASLELVYLRSEVPSYQVTVDLAAEFGSYSGPVTRFAEVRSGTIEWLGAVDVRTGKSVEVAVASTLKSEWKLLLTTSGDKEVLQIACRPDFDASGSDAGIEFLITFSRFAFEDGRWQRYTRVRKGFWENDRAFPTRAQFP